MTDDSKRLIRNSTAEFLIFTAQAGEQSIEARYEDETVWLTQKLMAELFAVDVRTVSEHLKNIFSSGELGEDSVIRKFRITAADGKSYAINHYNLDAIISVGYRVNSVRATQFRQWATGVLRESAIKAMCWTRSAWRTVPIWVRTTSNTCWPRYARFGCPSASSIRRSPISTPRQWITTAMRPPQRPSSPRCRTSCISPSMGTLPPSLSCSAPTAASRIWD